jgi:hypothetical protein
VIVMQAKRQKRKATTAATAHERSRTGRDFSINPPRQIAPVDRLYMRAIVGRQSPSASTVPGRKAAKAQSGKAQSGKAQSGRAQSDKHTEPKRDYLVGLTTFHIRTRPR